MKHPEEDSARASVSRRARALLWATAILLGSMAAVYAVAWLLRDHSTVARALVWMDSDVDDYRRFAARTIQASPDPYIYDKGPGYPDGIASTAALAMDDTEIVEPPG